MISTTNDKQLYFKAVFDLVYTENGHGICLTGNLNHFNMQSDLTSTQHASYDVFHSELTNCSLSIELKFARVIPNSIRVFTNGEKLVQFLLTVTEEFPKNKYFYPLMDEDDVSGLVQLEL